MEINFLIWSFTGMQTLGNSQYEGIFFARWGHEK